MDMEISSGAAGAVPKLEHPPAEPRPPAREARRSRVLLAAGLVALPLLPFFVLGRESASAVWDIASAKLVAVNNGGGTYFHCSRHSFPSHSNKSPFHFFFTNLHFKIFKGLRSRTPLIMVTTSSSAVCSRPAWTATRAGAVTSCRGTTSTSPTRRRRRAWGWR